MSYFLGRHNFVMFMFFVLLFFFFIGTSAGVRENPLMFELSSREDFVHMAGYGEEKLSAVLVTGTVLCEACLDGEAELHPWPVSGALVAVACQTHGNDMRSSWARGFTDEYGDFIIDLPSRLHAISDLDKTCSVKVLQLPKDSLCQRTFAGKHKELRLSSIGNGIRTYTCGSIRFLHSTSNPFQACTKKRNDEEGMSW